MTKDEDDSTYEEIKTEINNIMDSLKRIVEYSRESIEKIGKNDS